MEFANTDGRNPDFSGLCRELDRFLESVAEGSVNQAEYAPYNQLSTIHDVILVYDNGVPIGCAAFKQYDRDCAEVKRVFVKPAFRGQGIASQLLRRIEAYAGQKGYRTLIVETGKHLRSAVSLYQRNGYVRIPNYPPYQDKPQSVCMKKNLV